VPREKQLIINLDAVPKFLKNLVDDWSPECMIVSYKLETDPSILIEKAKYALARYQHDLVIGNLLTTRKWEVVFISPGREAEWIRVPVPGQENSTVPLDPKTLTDEPDMEVESLIVPAVIKLHAQHIRENTRHI
jgi:phosphopantothenate-cysteine ligase